MPRRVALDAETRRATTAFVAAKLEADARWAPHVDGPLKERNTVENVHKWACGRPAGMDDDGMGEHSEEDDHDFDVGLGGGGFTRDGFDRYGGVGLDDDDEDDEEDDDGPVPPGAAGLFQGDASARLASLTLSNALPGDEEEEEEEEDEGGEGGGTAAGSSAFAETILRLQMLGEDFDDSGGFSSSEEDEDDVVLGDDADADEDAPTVVVPAFAPAGEDEVLTGAESPSAGTFSRMPARSIRPEDAERANAAKAEPVEHDEDEPASEFGSVRYWGAAIDDSLVPDDA